MKEITTFAYTPEQLQELANQIKDLVAESTGLEDELSDYIITVSKKKGFGKFFEKYFPNEHHDPDSYHFIITKSTAV